ncbi:hypothetical protein ACMU_06175 [Actibacterium mucosum KCTC 23349]|uniref:FAD assembly factor SdhE n=1 Tax=Actibacterium mucosum KCTC 23349 TaxID=1454373 RepID=A0A037ZLK4_9RHOB|nr:succinate dehydrogenase assembly factor 2 [Actibacterium mucosum]KAJ56524.1 hypothetical protein ACMU_06175 [Actibacterium mucosum KCTC 23349]
MTELPRDIRLKRIYMRATHRGMKEMDVILGRFCDAELATLDDATLDQFEAMMQENDQELFTWVTGRVEAAPEFADLVARITSVATPR